MVTWADLCETWADIHQRLKTKIKPEVFVYFLADTEFLLKFVLKVSDLVNVTC